MGKSKKSSVADNKRDWKDMNYDLLLKIFVTLSTLDFDAVSKVCRSWREVCKDRVFWGGNVLDTSGWRRPPIPTSFQAYTALLLSLLDLSNGQVHCLKLGFTFYLENRAIHQIAIRTRNMKRLVLPGYGRVVLMTKRGIDLAMEQWTGLESLTLTTTYIAPLFLEAISRNCPNFSQLKLTCHLTLKISRALVKHVPKLKVLSLQSVRLNKNALVYLVKHLKELEVLNVSHGFIISGNRVNNTVVYPLHMIPQLLNKIPRKPTTLMYCDGYCAMCQEVFVSNMTNQWREPETYIWRDDEIPTLRV